MFSTATPPPALLCLSRWDNTCSIETATHRGVYSDPVSDVGCMASMKVPGGIRGRRATTEAALFYSLFP